MLLLLKTYLHVCLLNTLIIMQSIKLNLKQIKQKQKELIQQVNGWKASIDCLNEKMASVDANEDEVRSEDAMGCITTSTKLQELQEQLDIAKQSYKLSHNELKVCKALGSKLETDKKTTLALIMSAFEKCDKDEV
jgi:hypothetical protein